MTKKAVMISIDDELHAKAKEKDLNISSVCEDALKHNVNGAVNDPEEKRQCHFCKTTWFGDLAKTLIWLCPDEVWICDKCLKQEVKKVSVCVGTRYR